MPEFREIGGLIGALLAALARDPAGVEGAVRERVRALCAAHPIYAG